jgi:hypothetical protein
MKKTNFFCVVAIALVGVFGMTSCSTDDNPAPIVEPTEPEDPVFEETSLLDVPYGTWSAWVDGELTNPWTPTWNEGVSDGLPYGDGSVIGYADLSDYDLLVVSVTEGEPRFLLNRDVDEGQWNEDEAESHLIDNTKGGWSEKYFKSEPQDDGSTAWMVDLSLIVEEKGYAHLHAIKGANWANCTVTKMVVLKLVK